MDKLTPRNRWAPSRVLIVKDCAGVVNDPRAFENPIRVLAREVQLPFQQILDTLMGPEGSVVVYDVRELLADIDRLKQQVIDIVNTCSMPLMEVGREQKGFSEEAMKQMRHMHPMDVLPIDRPTDLIS